MLGGDAVQGAEEFQLERLVFGGRFDDQFTGAELIQRGSDRDACQDFFDAGIEDDPLLCLALEVLGDGGKPLGRLCL